MQTVQVSQNKQPFLIKIKKLSLKTSVSNTWLSILLPFVACCWIDATMGYHRQWSRLSLDRLLRVQRVTKFHTGKLTL